MSLNTSGIPRGNIFARLTVLKHFLCDLLFSCVFSVLQRKMAVTNDEDSTTGKLNEQHSSTLFAALTSMKASIHWGNYLLQELVSRERSSPDDETKILKRRKSHTRSQKATVSSDEDENDASEKANVQRQHDASEADAISLFVLDDMEDGESDNANLLSEIGSDSELLRGHRSAICKWPC